MFTRLAVTPPWRRPYKITGIERALTCQDPQFVARWDTFALLLDEQTHKPPPHHRTTPHRPNRRAPKAITAGLCAATALTALIIIIAAGG